MPQDHCPVLELRVLHREPSHTGPDTPLLCAGQLHTQINDFSLRGSHSNKLLFSNINHSDILQVMAAPEQAAGMGFASVWPSKKWESSTVYPVRDIPWALVTSPAMPQVLSSTFPAWCKQEWHPISFYRPPSNHTQFTYLNKQRHSAGFYEGLVPY